MDSKSIDKVDLVEERQELMVFPSENNTMKKPHFLKPTMDESEALRPPDINPSSLHVSFRGWKLPNEKFKLWAKKMTALHKPIWIKAGIFEAIKASTYRIRKNPSLILSLVQKWCPDTKSFIFPWGEATITLEDVNMLLRFSVLGSSVFAPLQSSEMEEAVKTLNKQYKENMSLDSWILSFVDDQFEHEAFLVFWLSNYVFPDAYSYSVSRHVFHIAVRLARGERIALAPAVLASLYRDLDLIRASASYQKIHIKSLFKLIQVWMWERMKNIRPEAKVIPNGEPRIAQWGGLTQSIETVGLILVDDFEWRPYAKPLQNWNPPRFYIEEAQWITTNDSLDDDIVTFARCVRVSKLVGIGFVEDYYPNRVAMQFGFAQDIPSLDSNQSNDITRFTTKEAWDHYNISLDGLKLYIPSCHATPFVTARYREWWMMISSVLETQKKTINPSDNIVDRYDDSDADVPPKVLPLSQVLDQLGDEKKKAKCWTYKRPRTKRGRKDHGKSGMECHQRQDSDDDNMTIAQVMKSRKKCSGVENSKGERSKLETDNNNVVLHLPQKHAFRGKTVALSTTDDNKNSTEAHVAVNGVNEKKEDEERLKQRKVAIEELTMKLEARMLKVENTLAMIKEWKLRRIHSKT